MYLHGILKIFLYDVNQNNNIYKQDKRTVYATFIKSNKYKKIKKDRQRYVSEAKWPAMLKTVHF